MATHSSLLAWRIPGTGGPGGLLSMELHGVGHDWSGAAEAAAVFPGRLNKGGHTLIQGQGASCPLRIVCRGLEQMREPSWFSAGTEMLAQECLLWSWTSAGDSQFSAGTDAGSGVFVRHVYKGRTQPSLVQKPKCGLRSASQGLNMGRTQPASGQGQLWGQEYVLGDLTRAEPRLVQCSDWDAGSGVFVGDFNKHRTQPDSVQCVRWGLNSVSGSLYKGRTHLSSGAGSAF